MKLWEAKMWDIQEFKLYHKIVAISTKKRLRVGAWENQNVGHLGIQAVP